VQLDNDDNWDFKDDEEPCCIGCQQPTEYLIECRRHLELGQFCKYCLHESLVTCEECEENACRGECATPVPHHLCMDCFKVCFSLGAYSLLAYLTCFLRLRSEREWHGHAR
jgi:hypothetical protein